MITTLEKVRSILALAFSIAIALACYHSLTLVFLLMIAYCVYKCWIFFPSDFNKVKARI